jgi:hypothetical protein
MKDNKHLFMTEDGCGKIYDFVLDKLKFFCGKEQHQAHLNPNKFNENERQNFYAEKLIKKALDDARLQLKNGENIAVTVELSKSEAESGKRQVLKLTKKDFCFE